MNSKSIIAVLFVFILLYPFLFLIPVSIIPVAEGVVTDSHQPDTSKGRYYLGKSDRRYNCDDPDNWCDDSDPNANIAASNLCNELIVAQTLDSHKILFGQEDTWRCFKTVVEWDKSNWETDNISNIKLSYSRYYQDNPCCNSFNNNTAEIYAKVSSSPCQNGEGEGNDANTAYYNAIDSTWTLIKTDWTPLEDGENSGEVNLDALSSLMTSSDSYLCLAFSQAGPDLGGCGPMNCAHNDWQIKDLYLTIIRGGATLVPVVLTSLEFNQPVSDATEGDSVTFTGRLTNAVTGAGISGQPIYIYDLDDHEDDLLVTITTDSNGYYSITWTATKLDDEDNSIEVYAKYSGNTGFNPSIASAYIILLGAFGNQWRISTDLVLDQPDSPVIDGSTITFTGRLIHSETGAGITSQTIYIYDEDGAIDYLIGSGNTDLNGYYSITWIVAELDNDDSIEVYAKYSGNTEFNPSTSTIYSIVIVDSIITDPITTTNTQLTLDTPTSPVQENTTITFTGSLIRTDTNAGITSQQISIYGNYQLLATGSTDSNGNYSISWIVETSATNNTIQIYAKYSGNSSLNLSTIGSTSSTYSIVVVQIHLFSILQHLVDLLELVLSRPEV